MGKNIVVVSAVNFTNGGPLAILHEFLDKTRLFPESKFIALVNNKALFQNDYPTVEFIEFPEVKKSWVSRLFFEYWHCRKLSKSLQATHWLCLHDMSAKVSCSNQYVYCHNPSPFYDFSSFKEIHIEPKFFLFKLFYGVLYRINIKNNKAVFVQQNWLKKKFEIRYGLKNVVVNRPESSSYVKNECFSKKSFMKKDDINIFYPAVPRVFKNFEVIINAAKLLKDSHPEIKFHFTLSGTENKYSKMLKEQCLGMSNIFFHGYLSREKINDLYLTCDVVCFPSKLETWGLPLTEAKKFDSWIVASDLPYAHETVGDYSKILFFPPNDPQSLVMKINDLISDPEKHLIYDNPDKVFESLNDVTSGFSGLISYMLNDK